MNRKISDEINNKKVNMSSREMIFIFPGFKKRKSNAANERVSKKPAT